MTEENELQPNDFQNDEQEEQLSELGDNNNGLSDLSLSSTSDVDQKQEDLLPQVNDQIDKVLHIKDDNEEEEEDDLTKFIKQAQQQGYNCLDLSKKDIHKFPSALLEFPSLQVNI